MIENVVISGTHYELTDDIKKYINKKIGRIDRFVPRHARKSLHADVKLIERKTRSDKYECEVLLHLPERQLSAKASTVNMFAAVDIVETKLKNQLKKYKDLHGGDRQDHHSKLRRILRRRQRVEEDPHQLN